MNKKLYGGAGNNIIMIYFMKGGGACIVLVLSVVMARILGAQEYGVVAYALSWLTVLSIPAKLGTDALAIREVAIFKRVNEIGKVKGLIVFTSKAVLLSSFVTFSGAMAVFWYTADSSVFLSLFLALAMLPFVSLNSLQQAVLLGLDMVVQSQLFEIIIKPALLILGLVIGFFLGVHFDGVEVLLLYLGASIFIGLLYFRELATRLESVKLVRPIRRDIISWSKSILPFTMLGATYIINKRADVIMIGILKSTESAGIYHVATNGADIISFMLVAMNTVLAPRMASMYSQKEFQKLETMLKKASRIGFISGVPLMVMMIFLGGWLLHFFGQAFVLGKYALIILCGGQMVNMATGSVAVLLNMSGNEKSNAIGFSVASIGNILLNLILIPVWGINGAAVATFTSMTFSNLLLLHVAVSRLRINPSVLGAKCQTLGQNCEKKE